MFKVLSLEYLQQKVPSIFTENRAERTSGKYQHISTARVIDGLLAEGFVPTWAAQCRCRLTEKKAYTKHMLRFRHVNAKPTSSGLFSEIVLVNSHDGLSSYRLMAGVYRLVCSNGLIAGKTYNEIRVRHQGDILGEVIEGTYEIIKDSQKMIEAADQMSAIKLHPREKMIFAEAAHTLRFEDSSISEAIKPVQLLEPRRFEELEKDDLFTVFNVAQEHIMKGGLRGYAKNLNGRYKKVRSRAVSSIDQNTALNRALWSLAEKMMELKSA
jgi:hypothetical protein